jgi:hypothetical protein
MVVVGMEDVKLMGMAMGGWGQMVGDLGDVLTMSW